MAFADKKGIALAGGFKLQAESPLDARQQVDTIEERDELVTLHAAWEGMQVYVTSEKKTYEYHGEDGWSATVTGVAYVHPTTAGNKHIPAGGATGNILGYAADGTAKWLAPDKTTVGLDKVDNTSDMEKPVSTAQKAALDKKVDKVDGKGLSANDYTDEEKAKLAGIEDNANNYTHPESHPASMITETETLKIMTAEERTKLAGIDEGANKYVHPASHPATMITEDATHRFFTDDERTKLEGIEANANNYVHPDTHSIDMITETVDKKVMTAAERTKLAGIEEGANKYIHPETHAATMIIEDATHRFTTDAEKAKWNAKANVIFADEAPATAPVGAILYCSKQLAASAEA